jgi:Ca-activated chloride channel family protein
MSFNDNPKLVLDWSSDRKEISKAIDKSSVLAGGTAFFDACYMTVEKIKQGKNSRRVILLVSDGQVGFSRYSLKELRSLVRETDVIIYSIGLLDPLIDSLTGYGREILKELSSITGGKAYFPKTAGEFAQAVIKVSVELRNQYIIGVKPAGDGKWHEIKIRVKPKENSESWKQNKLEPFIIRSRSGYYADNRNG